MTRLGMLTKNVDIFLQGSTKNGAIDYRFMGAVQRQGVLISVRLKRMRCTICSVQKYKADR